MNTVRYILLSVITIFFMPVMYSQDITGDWYGRYDNKVSEPVKLNIYKDHNKLKAAIDDPSKLRFDQPVFEITLNRNTLFFAIGTSYMIYKGTVNKGYTKIDGEMTIYGYKHELDFYREKMMINIPVDYSSFTEVPAEIKVLKTGNFRKIPYTGVRVVKAGIPKIIEIDTSKLKVITPGLDTVLNPMTYKLPQALTEYESARLLGFSQWAPITVRPRYTEPLQAQPMRMRDAACLGIQYLDMDQGLIDPQIWSMLEDSRGTLWFGSAIEGICRYDGKSFTYFNNSKDQIRTGTKALLEDRNGNIWIGTDWGLCVYDGKSFIQDRRSLFTSIFSILETRDGILWVGTTHGAFEKNGNIWTQYTKNEGLTGNNVFSIIEAKYGNLWFGTDEGVSRYDGVSFTHFTENEGLIFNKVRSVLEDKQGNIWFGTEQGASRYDGKSFRQYSVNEGLSNNYIMSLYEDHYGNIWFGTFGGGVNFYNGNNFIHYTTGTGLNSNTIIKIGEDKYGNIWLTSFEGGVMKFQKNLFIYLMPLEKAGGINFVNSIIEDQKGNIWLGPFGYGMVKYDGESFMAMTVKEGSNDHYINTVRKAIEDKDGNIWFVNDRCSLQKFNGKSITVYENKEIWNSYFGNCIYEDSMGRIWLSTWGEGLKIFDGISFIDFPQTILPADHLITSILQDRNGNIWLGTCNFGLFKYDGKYITQYTISEGLSSMFITAIFEDNTGNLWIGTIDKGVNKFNGQSFMQFTEKEGLVNNSLSSIIEDKKGNIWVGTKRGLSLLSPRGDGDYSITSFGEGDGLKELYFNENSVCLDSKNRIWWGTGDIITMLDLNTFEITPKPPAIQLNSIHLNQKYVDFGALLPNPGEPDKILPDSSNRMKMRGLKFSDIAPFYNYPLDLELPHYLNNVTFNFSAIDWAAPQSIKYQYILVGMDKDWSPLTMENKADYKRIPSGKYKFRVKAIGIANVWSETFEYPFIVRPPFWFRWWACTLYGLILILLGRYYINYIISRERIKAQIQIKQAEVENMQELNQMKSRFFANISHEFRTPLTLLMGPINDLLKKRDRLKESDRKLLAIMKRNAGRLQQLINQLLDLSKLETGKLKLEVSEGDLTWFVRTIILSFLSLAESKRINYEYELEDSPAECFYDEDKVEKITTNLVSNALKFTPEEGSVMVTLQYPGEKDAASGQYAEITVKDTGPGIPEEEQEKIFDRFYQVSRSDTRDFEGSGIGLALAKELVELYRGEIRIESKPGEGSTFTVRLPVSGEHFRVDEIVAGGEKRVEREFIEDREIPVEEAAKPADIGAVIDKNRPIILIVEDNTDLRRYISGNLSKNYRLLEAENGREGLTKAIESIPDIVISDLMMPEMDGVEMCDRLKKDPRTNHIPLVMLTARADRDSKLESLETGADDYIIKPFDAGELQVRVKNLIDQRKSLREHYRKEFLADPAGHELPPPEDEFLVRVLDCLKKHLVEPGFSVEQMGEELHLSRIQLYRKLLSLTGYTPSDYIRNVRLKMAARMFLEGHKNITRVLYTVGFNTPSYFTQSFHELFGLNPSEYIKQKT